MSGDSLFECHYLARGPDQDRLTIVDYLVRNKDSARPDVCLQMSDVFLGKAPNLTSVSTLSQDDTWQTNVETWRI